MCAHTKLSVEADPCFGRVWTASCSDCADGDLVADEYVSSGVSGSGRTKLEALQSLRCRIVDTAEEADETPNTATVDTLIAEQEMLEAADRMAAKSREVLAAFRAAAQ